MKPWVHLALGCAAFTCGCGSVGAPTGVFGGHPGAESAPGARHLDSKKGPAGLIKHVVIVIQENRTLDNLFQKFPGAITSPTGTTSTGQTVALVPLPIADPEPDINHGHTAWSTAYRGGEMDGFDLVNHRRPEAPYTYVRMKDARPYYNIAATYELADMFFQANTGPSFTAHQYYIAGQSALADENPNSKDVWGCDSPASATVKTLDTSQGGFPYPDGAAYFPCYGKGLPTPNGYRTLGDQLEAARLDWRYYAPAQGQPGYIWSAYDAVAHVRNNPGRWMAHVRSPETSFFSDVAQGQLAAVTWIVPTKVCSDHPGDVSTYGPAWVTQIVNAVGKSAFWNTTAVLIVWDDWGGFYDHVKPPYIAPDQMGLGFRVPLLVVSPYPSPALPAHVSHTIHTVGGVLKFTEEAFHLKALGDADDTPDDLPDMFDFAQPPQAFTPVPQPTPLCPGSSSTLGGENGAELR
jgi:phospholipase C